MPDISDLIGFAIDKNPTDFSSTLESILQSKVMDAIADRKIEIASNLYGTDGDSDEA